MTSCCRAAGTATRGTTKLDGVLVKGGCERGRKRSRGLLGRPIIYPRSVNESLPEPLDASLASPQVSSCRSPKAAERDCSSSIFYSDLVSKTTRGPLELVRPKFPPAVQEHNFMLKKKSFHPEHRVRPAELVIFSICAGFRRVGRSGGELFLKP